MSRSYGASLGCLALAASIVYGLINQQSPDIVLVRSVLMLVAFTILGWVVGESASTAVRHSVEVRYRSNVEELRRRTAAELAKLSSKKVV